METSRTAVTRILIAVEGEMTMRAAQSLAVHPGVDEITLLAPAKSSYFPTVKSADGHDMVVGGSVATEVGADSGIPAVVWGPLGDQPGLEHCSIEGLALALAVGTEAVDTVAVAIPGDPGGDQPVTFPSPIDTVQTNSRRVDGHEVLVGHTDGDLAAAMVWGSRLHRVILDSHPFMAGIALAAAAATLVDNPVDGAAGVWTRASDYLGACVDMGLVIGERAPTA